MSLRVEDPVKRACLFDLDGTLLNTLSSMHISVNTMLRELGFPGISRDECRRFVGCGADHLIMESLRTAGDPELAYFPKAREIYFRVFSYYCTYEVVPYDGIQGLLKSLKDEGVTLGVLSNKPHEQTKHVIANAFGDSIFSVVLGQQNERPRKPDPAGIYEAISLMDTNREHCVYIGDSEIDARTGRNAGVYTVIVTWGFRNRELLVCEHPDSLADTPGQLNKIIQATLV